MTHTLFPNNYHNIQNIAKSSQIIIVPKKSHTLLAILKKAIHLSTQRFILSKKGTDKVFHYAPTKKVPIYNKNSVKKTNIEGSSFSKYAKKEIYYWIDIY
jgi:hypothetical protein